MSLAASFALHSLIGCGPVPPISWLPHLDLNQDKQIQNLLCYRYTMRQGKECDILIVRCLWQYKTSLAERFSSTFTGAMQRRRSGKNGLTRTRSVVVFCLT